MMGLFHAYETREALAEALATGVSAVLAGSIATRGSATLAVSGGSTPRIFFERLSDAPIDWAQVTVVLVDERWVPEADERSNAGLVRRHLLQGRAAEARFLPLYRPGEAARKAAENVARDIAGLPQPLDVVVLGMGTDGHTASFFPGSPDLATALSMDAPAAAAVEAPGAAEPRMTLTLRWLVEARFLALHIEGDAKRRTLEAARQAGPVEEMPVRAVITHPREDAMQVFWAP